MTVDFHSLLYLDPDTRSMPNFPSRELIRDYAALGRLLSRTVRSVFGCCLTVHSNSPDELASLTGGEFHVAELRCPEWVPKGTRFYPAHFKVDLARLLISNKVGGVLLDLDMVALHANQLCQLLERGVLAYDITDQVFPAYSWQRVEHDLRLLGVTRPDPRWYGGEFLSIPANCPSALSTAIDVSVAQYLSNLPLLHHHGDEAIMSAALGALDETLLPIVDAGCRQVIVRQWSDRTLHAQAEARVVEQTDFVHLPSSKGWLVRIERSDRLPTPGDVRSHLVRTRYKNAVIGAALRLRGA